MGRTRSPQPGRRGGPLPAAPARLAASGRPSPPGTTSGHLSEMSGSRLECSTAVPGLQEGCPLRHGRGSLLFRVAERPSPTPAHCPVLRSRQTRQAPASTSLRTLPPLPDALLTPLFPVHGANTSSAFKTRLASLLPTVFPHWSPKQTHSCCQFPPSVRVRPCCLSCSGTRRDVKSSLSSLPGA